MIHTERDPGTSHPRLAVPATTPETTAVALLVHGGREVSHRPVRPWQSAVLRMRPFEHSIRREDPTVAVARLQYRVRGWNGDGLGTIDDVSWALDALRASIGTRPVVLVGHSLGGRAAVDVAGDRSVSGVVALAPWLPRSEPVEQLRGRALVLLHGSRDHTTDPARTAAYAERATGHASAVVSLRIGGTGHAMLTRAAVWHRLTARFVSAIATGTPLDTIGPLPARVVPTPSAVA